MTISQWYPTVSGKRVNSCGGILGECVALVQKYANEVLGVSGCPVFPVPAARLMVSARPDAFTWIPNTPTGVPPYGAIVVFNGRTGGGYGHTGVAIEGCDLNQVRIIQQNDPIGSGVSIKVYPYTNVSGWLVKKETNIPQPSGGGDVMNQGENEYARANDLHIKLRGRVLDRNIFNQLVASGTSWLRYIEILSDDPEAQARQQDATVGQVARRDNWEGQIHTLVQQFADSQKQVASLQKQIDELKKNQGGVDQTTKDQITETNTIVKSIWSKITSIFK